MNSGDAGFSVLGQCCEAKIKAIWRFTLKDLGSQAQAVAQAVP